MKLKIGFGYEQSNPGLYLYDVETGLVVASEDVEPSQETQEYLSTFLFDLNEMKISNEKRKRFGEL